MLSAKRLIAGSWWRPATPASDGKPAKGAYRPEGPSISLPLIRWAHIRKRASMATNTLFATTTSCERHSEYAAVRPGSHQGRIAGGETQTTSVRFGGHNVLSEKQQKLCRLKSNDLGAGRRGPMPWAFLQAVHAEPRPRQSAGPADRARSSAFVLALLGGSGSFCPRWQGSVAARFAIRICGSNCASSPFISGVPFRKAARHPDQ